MKVTNIIVALYRTYYTNLNGMKHLNENQVKLPEGLTFDSIPIKSPASLIINMKDDDKNIIYTATLKFFTCVEFLSTKKYAYLAKIKDGRIYLIGSSDRPFTTTTYQNNFPDDPKSNQLTEVTVTYQSENSIPFVVK